MAADVVDQAVQVAHILGVHDELHHRFGVGPAPGVHTADVGAVIGNGRRQFASRKTIIFPQPEMARRTIQKKERLAVISEDVNMRRTVVVGIDDNPELANPEDCRRSTKDSTGTEAVGLFAVKTYRCRIGY